MRAAILQSAYIPWKGYFDIIGSVDIFVIYDDAQYRKNHWHNRNIIKTAHGKKWLTVPVTLPRGLSTPIEEVLVANSFAERHWRSILQSYSRAPCWSMESSFLEDLFSKTASMKRLSEINFLFLQAITKHLGFDTSFCWSSSFPKKGDTTGRLVGICERLGATTYVTGLAAKAYLDVAQFHASGIGVEWFDYQGYPAYPQVHGSFDHQVSIIDLLLNVGPDARAFMRAGAAQG